MAKFEDNYFSTSLTTSTKSQACFFLFLLVLLLLAVPYRFSTSPSSMASTSNPSRPPSSKAMAEQAFPRPQFEASMHEVPSGPNPTSNK
ncbi:CLAVATA3/ESR (CLE)-related protein TDIF, partial [Cucurbita argyrosperma subsp. sororia]